MWHSKTEILHQSKVVVSQAEGMCNQPGIPSPQSCSMTQANAFHRRSSLPILTNVICLLTPKSQCKGQNKEIIKKKVSPPGYSQHLRCFFHYFQLGFEVCVIFNRKSLHTEDTHALKKEREQAWEGGEEEKKRTASKMLGRETGLEIVLLAREIKATLHEINGGCRSSTWITVSTLWSWYKAIEEFEHQLRLQRSPI